MTGYRDEFNVTAASTAIRQDFKGNSEYICGMGGNSLNATAEVTADINLDIGQP